MVKVSTAITVVNSLKSKIGAKTVEMATDFYLVKVALAVKVVEEVTTVRPIKNDNLVNLRIKQGRSNPNIA